jgi:hypothetical protein
VNPELPYLAAGLITILGGVRKEKRFPANGVRAIIGTLVLVLAASATTGSKAAPVVRAVGLLFLLAAVFATVPAFAVKTPAPPIKKKV